MPTSLPWRSFVVGSWIVKNTVSEVAKGQHGGVERHANDFGVTRSAAADVVVRRIRVATAGVTRFDRFHPGELVENRLEAPEASAAEDGRFLGA